MTIFVLGIVLGVLSRILMMASLVAIVFAIRRRVPKSLWRARAEIGAFAMTVVSVMLFVTMGIYAQLISGFPYLDPTLLRIYAYGMLTSLLGIVIGMLGTGRVRAAIMGLSGTMLVIWVLIAMNE